jgi:hypothetical protein
MSEKLPKPKNLKDSVNAVIKDNQNREYPSIRFIQLFSNAKTEDDYARIISNLIMNPSPTAEAKLYEIFKMPKKASWRYI